MSMLKHSGFRFPQHSSSEGVFDKKKEEKETKDHLVDGSWTVSVPGIGQIASPAGKLDHLDPNVINFVQV